MGVFTASDDFPRDMQHHVARVFAVVAVCILASFGGTTALLAMVPWVSPYPALFTVFSFIVNVAGLVAFDSTPADRTAVRFIWLLTVCVCSISTVAFFGKLVFGNEFSEFAVSLLTTAAICTCYSAAAIITPPKKRVFHMVALAFVALAMATVGVSLWIYSISIFSTIWDFVAMLLLLAWIVFFVRWEANAIIAKGSDADPVGDAYKTFSDFFNIYSIIIASCSSDKSDSSERAPLVGESNA